MHTDGASVIKEALLLFDLSGGPGLKFPVCFYDPWRNQSICLRQTDTIGKFAGKFAGKLVSEGKKAPLKLAPNHTHTLTPRQTSTISSTTMVINSKLARRHELARQQYMCECVATAS